MVYYASQFVMDNTNGAICHVATQAADTITGVAAQYLMHVPANTWSAPAVEGSFSPASLELTDAKYSRTYDPATATTDIFYAGHYISVWWYQPKYASSYSLVARYGKANYVGAYCVYGTGSTTYFDAPSSGTLLTGAVTLAVSGVLLGSSFLVM